MKVPDTMSGDDYRRVSQLLGSAALGFTFNRAHDWARNEVAKRFCQDRRICDAMSQLLGAAEGTAPPDKTSHAKDPAIADAIHAIQNYAQMGDKVKSSITNFVSSLSTSEAFKNGLKHSGRKILSKLTRKFGLAPGETFEARMPGFGGQSHAEQFVPSAGYQRHITEKAGSSAPVSSLTPMAQKGELVSTAHPDALMFNQSLAPPVSIQNKMTDISTMDPTSDEKGKTSIHVPSVFGDQHRMLVDSSKDPKKENDDVKSSSSLATNKSNSAAIQGKIGVSQAPIDHEKKIGPSEHGGLIKEGLDLKLFLQEVNQEKIKDVGSSMPAQLQLNLTSYATSGKGTGGQQTMGAAPDQPKPIVGLQTSSELKTDQISRLANPLENQVTMQQSVEEKKIQMMGKLQSTNGTAAQPNLKTVIPLNQRPIPTQRAATISSPGQEYEYTILDKVGYGLLGGLALTGFTATLGALAAPALTVGGAIVAAGTAAAYGWQTLSNFGKVVGYRPGKVGAMLDRISGLWVTATSVYSAAKAFFAAGSFTRFFHQMTQWRPWGGGGGGGGAPAVPGAGGIRGWLRGVGNNIARMWTSIKGGLAGLVGWAVNEQKQDHKAPVPPIPDIEAGDAAFHGFSDQELHDIESQMDIDQSGSEPHPLQAHRAASRTLTPTDKKNIADTVIGDQRKEHAKIRSELKRSRPDSVRKKLRFDDDDKKFPFGDSEPFRPSPIKDGVVVEEKPLITFLERTGKLAAYGQSRGTFDISPDVKIVFQDYQTGSVPVTSEQAIADALTHGIKSETGTFPVIQQNVQEDLQRLQDVQNVLTAEQRAAANSAPLPDNDVEMGYSPVSNIDSKLAQRGSPVKSTSFGSEDLWKSFETQLDKELNGDIKQGGLAPGGTSVPPGAGVDETPTGFFKGLKRKFFTPTADTPAAKKVHGDTKTYERDTKGYGYSPALHDLGEDSPPSLEAFPFSEDKFLEMEATHYSPRPSKYSPARISAGATGSPGVVPNNLQTPSTPPRQGGRSPQSRITGRTPPAPPASNYGGIGPAALIVPQLKWLQQISSWLSSTAPVKYFNNWRKSGGGRPTPDPTINDIAKPVMPKGPEMVAPQPEQSVQSQEGGYAISSRMVPIPENYGMLRPWLNNGGADKVMEENNNVEAQITNRLIWNEFSNYQWDANVEKDNPLMLYNIIEEGRRFKGMNDEEELYPMRQQEALDEISKINMRFPFNVSKETEAAGQISMIDIYPEPHVPISSKQTGLLFHDVFIPPLVEIPLSDPLQKFTTIMGTQLPDSQRLSQSAISNWDWDPFRMENQYIYETVR